MTLSELIAKVTTMRPSEYDKDDLTQWVNEVEFMVVDEVLRHSNWRPAPSMDPVKVVAGEDNYRPDRKTPPKPIEFKPYSYTLDAERQLLIPDQFSDVYMTYLFSKIDYSNAEIDRYQLDQQMFESEWLAYASWFRRAHYPRRRHEVTNYKYNPLASD